MSRAKYIGRWVMYETSSGEIRRGKITGIEFHQLLGKPLFHLISPYGNTFRLTREEIIL